MARCLSSLTPFKVIVGDLGSTDDTIKICESFNVPVMKLTTCGAAARNSVVENTDTDWQMWVEPWEELTSGQEELLWAANQPEPAHRVYNIQGEVVVKPTRLWRRSSGNRFVRPVYESLSDEATSLIECVITGTTPVRFDEAMAVLAEWRRQQPHAADVEYYTACTYLAAARYDEFLTHAKHFLFRTKNVSPASILTSYHMAVINLFIKNNYGECVQHVVRCLAEYPTMAELWCLLGDLFCKMNHWHRAVAFYDNAILMGGHRRTDDPMPVEITKYREYPEKMLANCRNVIQKIHSG